MTVTVLPSHLSGSFRAPDSKSMLIRYILLAALADAPTRIEFTDACGDAKACAGCVKRLGAQISGGSIFPISKPKRAVLDCGESAATLRFLMAATAALGVGAELQMSDGLAARPIKPLADALTAHGASIERRENGAISVSSKLRGGEFRLRGDISSQFISALLLAAPLTGEECAIVIENRIESRGYIEMTLSAMEEFGVRADFTENVIHVPRNQVYASPEHITVEGDWSGAAAVLTATAISKSRVKCDNLRENSKQSDRAISDILRKFESPAARRTIDVSDIPDIAPLIAARAAFSNGETVLHGTGRLKFKECDRADAICRELTKIGADISMSNDSIVVHGHGGIKGGEADSHGDHRIEMMLAAAACGSEIGIRITNGGVTAKSYPNFYSDMRRLGARVCEEK